MKTLSVEKMETLEGGSMSWSCGIALAGMGVAIGAGFFTGGLAALIYFQVGLVSGGASVLASCID